MRLRFVAAVLLVIAVIVGAFAVTRIESLRDGVLVLAGGLALAAVVMATAIANAEARTEVQRLDDEQAALRRVATLVAQGVPPAELFSAVTKEVALSLLDNMSEGKPPFKPAGCSRVEIHGSRVMRPRISIGCTKTVA